MKPRHVTDLTEEQRKRAELLAAFGAGRLRDPISILTSIAISAAVTAGTTALAYLLAPKPAPNVQGGRSGDFQITRSEQGLFIPEIYGGDPGDGLGGVKIGAIVPWTSGLRRHVTTTGGGGKGGGGRPPETQTIEYDLDVALMWANNGPYTVRKIWANAETILNVDFAAPNIFQAEAATLSGAIEIIRDVAASRSRAVVLSAPTGKATFTFPRVNADTPVGGIFYYRSAGDASVRIIANGGAASDVTWGDTANTYTGIEAALDTIEGSNTVSVQVLSGGPVTLDYLYAERGFIDPDGNGGRHVTGRLRDVGTDDDYAQDDMLDPGEANIKTRQRYNGPWDFDAASGGTFVATLINSVQSVFYPGNTLQLPDPTIQAEVDARLGAGYTPAYRDRAYTVLKQFYLTPYGGVFPTFTGVLEHAVYRTLADITQQWCVRANLEAADYDFTDLEAVDVRGLRILNGPYAPNTLLEQAAEIYDCYFAEQYGQVVGKLRTGEIVASLTSADVGWVAVGESADGKSLSAVDAKYTPATELPRRVTVRHLDAAKDWEFNTQTEARQIVEGTAEKTVEGEWTLTPNEARAVAARQLYRAYIERVSYSFTLSTKWAWLNCGDLIEISTDDGFAYTLRLTAMRGGIGLIECEALPHTEAVYTQPALGQGGIFEPPPVPVAAQTIGLLLDLPLLREGDATNNNGVGIYIAAQPRTGDWQSWHGFGLYYERNGAWQGLASGNYPATIGRTVTALDDWPYASGIDDVSVLEVDLYGLSLSSVTEAEMLNGANMAIIGNEVLHFRSAVQQEGYLNRWRLTDFVRGVRGTEAAKNNHVENERFVLVNAGVQFVPLPLSDLNQEYDWKFISVGQDLDDTATLPFTWTGATAKPLPPLIAGEWDAAEENVMITLTPRARVGGVSYQPNFAAQGGLERFMIEIPDATPNARRQLVTKSQEIVATLIPDVTFPTNTLYRGIKAALSSENSYLSAYINLAGLSPSGVADLRLTPLRGVYANSWRIEVSYNDNDPFDDTVTVKAWEAIGDNEVELANVEFPATGILRVRLALIDGLVHYYAATGDALGDAFARGTASALAYVSLYGRVYPVSGTSLVYNVRQVTGQFAWLYSQEQREADGTDGLGLNELPVTAWQESDVVGEGLHAEQVV